MKMAADGGPANGFEPLRALQRGAVQAGLSSACGVVFLAFGTYTVLYGEPVLVDEIADDLNRSSSMMRRHFKRLAQEGFIEQRDDGWHLTDYWSRVMRSAR